MKGFNRNKLIASGFSALFIVATGFFSSASVPVLQQLAVKEQHFSSTVWLVAFIILAALIMVFLLLIRFNLLAQKNRGNLRQTR